VPRLADAPEVDRDHVATTREARAVQDVEAEQGARADEPFAAGARTRVAPALTSPRPSDKRRRPGLYLRKAWRGPCSFDGDGHIGVVHGAGPLNDSISVAEQVDATFPVELAGGCRAVMKGGTVSHTAMTMVAPSGAQRINPRGLLSEIQMSAWVMPSAVIEHEEGGR